MRGIVHAVHGDAGDEMRYWSLQPPVWTAVTPLQANAHVADVVAAFVGADAAYVALGEVAATLTAPHRPRRRKCRPRNL